MKNTLVSYETLQASRSFTMRRFALAATLSIAALILAGCKSQQEREQEELTALKAKYTTSRWTALPRRLHRAWNGQR